MVSRRAEESIVTHYNLMLRKGTTSKRFPIRAAFRFSDCILSHIQLLFGLAFEFSFQQHEKGQNEAITSFFIFLHI